MNSLCMASISEAPGDNNPALEPNVANYLKDQSRHLCLRCPRSFSPRSMPGAFPIVPSIISESMTGAASGLWADGGDQIDGDGVVAAYGAGHHDDLALDELVAPFLPRDPCEELFRLDRRVVWADIHRLQHSITPHHTCPDSEAEAQTTLLILARFYKRPDQRRGDAYRHKARTNY